MSLSMILACLWAVVASIIAALPPRVHWPAAYGLTALGIPLAGYVTYQNGPFWGLLVLAGGASMLRWPLIHLGRWCRDKLRAKRP
jgi:hypothetical protein